MLLLLGRSIGSLLLLLCFRLLTLLALSLLAGACSLCGRLGRLDVGVRVIVVVVVIAFGLLLLLGSRCLTSLGGLLLACGRSLGDLVTAFASPSISQKDNKRLLAPLVEEEFRVALSQMHSDKAPGPDELNPAFFKRFCPLCGADIFYACCHWLEMGVLPASVNETNIALIPKCDNHVSMKD